MAGPGGGIPENDSSYINMVELGEPVCAAVTRAALGVAAGLCKHCLCLSGGIGDPQVFNSREGKTAVMSPAEIEESCLNPMGLTPPMPG